MTAVLLQNGHEFFARALEGNVLARILAGQLHHGRTAPITRQIDGRTLVLDMQRAAGSLGRGLEAAFGQVHHGLEIAKGLVGFHRGELRIVIGIHALVAEDAPQLEHLGKTAHQQALQGKLRGDAQIVITIERIEMGDEGLCVRAADNRVQKRRFDFRVSFVVHEAANGGDDARAFLDRLANLGVHDQIDIALAIARLLVLQAVELLGKWAQALGHELER